MNSFVNAEPGFLVAGREKFRNLRKISDDVLPDPLHQGPTFSGDLHQDLPAVGGGVGALQHELLKAGVASAVDVDGSAAYIEASKEEAGRNGTTDRFEYHHGDFVDIAPSLEPADIVTLDRVLCCYPDVDAMVAKSTALAGEFYGLIYPRKTFGARGAIKLANLYMKLKQNPFRAFVHDPKHIDSMVRDAGFEPRYEGRTLVWHVVLYQRTRDERRSAPPDSTERAA